MFRVKYKLYLILFFIPWILVAEGLKIDKIASLKDSYYKVAVKNSFIYAAKEEGIEIFDATDLNSIVKK
ncbi:MAG: hypothetical protein GXO31_04155, partial [Epsilonproteobacteria bacterium]|nr:hypothetical protein [Campylobacterota bacterium]